MCGSEECPEPGKAWRDRGISGGNGETLWDRLASRRYVDERIWAYVDHDWVPSSSRPLLVLGADDETCQRGCAMVHVKWDGEVTSRTPGDVRLLTDVKADTPLTALAPAIGSFSFKSVPGLQEWTEYNEGDDSMTWGQYCFHRISYDKCGRDVIEFKKKLGDNLVQCAGEKWEILSRDRRWTWLRDAHDRRDRLRQCKTPRKPDENAW